jgi:hypothetical protein
MTEQPQKIFCLKHGRRLCLILALTAIYFFLAVSFPNVSAGADDEEIKITANFTEREITPSEKIELTLSRLLKADEGRPAIFIGKTDLSVLFTQQDRNLVYEPGLQPLPVGETPLTVYLVEPGGNWKTLAEFSLKVKTRETPIANAENANAGETAASSESAARKEADKWKTEFTPNVSLNIKGQNQTLTFPREAAPERNPFTDLAGQGDISFKIERRGWALTNQFNFAGSSFQQEALRFGELGNRAPRIDLSSYLIQFGKGRFSVKLGHVSFGSNRHLINSFSSRGITVTVPISKQNEISFAAMNGTSVVGFDNFIGVTRRKHSVVSAAFAREFIKERPNGLRVEFSVMRGSLLPLSNFNQGEVNDAEKSLGFGVKIIGSDKKQRLRYEVGFTRSRFTNPSDPLLEQGFNLTEIRPVWRTARYGEISFDFIQGLKLWKEKKLKVTGTYRHEEIEPLYRSIVAFAQADKRQNQFEVSASFGEINFVYGNLRDRDNLNDLASILKTLNRRNNMNISIALNSFFTPQKPKKWLPQISYSYDHVHQFGAFLPVDGEFRDLSQVPDQHNYVHAFNAQWQLSSKFNIGYRYNRAFQDNQQPGRERADFRTAVNAVTLGTKPHSTLDLDFDLSQEQLKNFEQPRIDRTFRFGTRATWRTPFLKNSSFSAGFSTTLAGDTNNFNDTRNAEFDAQWAYRFSFGKEKFKKTDAQFFIRYANRYGDVIDRLFLFNNFNKTQVFNFGLNFNIF